MEVSSGDGWMGTARVAFRLAGLSPVCWWPRQSGRR